MTPVTPQFLLPEPYVAPGSYPTVTSVDPSGISAAPVVFVDLTGHRSGRGHSGVLVTSGAGLGQCVVDLPEHVVRSSVGITRPEEFRGREGEFRFGVDRRSLESQTNPEVGWGDTASRGHHWGVRGVTPRSGGHTEPSRWVWTSQFREA